MRYKNIDNGFNIKNKNIIIDYYDLIKEKELRKVRENMIKYANKR